MTIDKLLKDFLFHCKFEKNLNPKTIYKNYSYWFTVEYFARLLELFKIII